MPLADIHADPSRYEGQMVRTCGDAHPGNPLLYMRGWIMGRSRGGLRLSRKPPDRGYSCVIAKVARSLKEDKAYPAPQIINISHPPIVPEGWELKVLNFLRP